MRLLRHIVCWACLTPISVSAADMILERLQTATVRENSQLAYHWEVTPVGNTAQLLTLVSRASQTAAQDDESIPLVAVLRDTLGDADPENDRVTSVWLLSYSRLNWGQRVLSAIPFFYWRVGQGSSAVSKRDLHPLLDLTAPEHSVLSNVSRDLVQWTMLDPATMPVRASSRAYRANELDGERVHLEEAISYLRQAPVSDGKMSLTKSELDTVIERLELRKRLLGGLVSEQRTASLGQEAGFEQERVRSRNWEILRECAEKTGLVFEPLDLAGQAGDYAILWFPLNGSKAATGTSLNLVWKILNIKDPQKDKRLRNWTGPIYRDSVDNQNQSVDAEVATNPTSGRFDSQPLQFIPLAVYSLTYPKEPLLVVDFRDELHLKRHELTQRTINELTSGVIGISHFTNWYYYVAADFYDFVVNRHGAAMNQAARLDSYSQFRAALALDRGLNPELRKEMQERVDSLSINPLVGSPDRDVRAAHQRYEQLLTAAAEPTQIENQLDKQRRAEIASFGETGKGHTTQALLHTLSFGLYSRRAKPDIGNLSRLDCERRVRYNLNLLDALGKAGTAPEVSYEISKIRTSVVELASLMPYVDSRLVRNHVEASLARVENLSQDAELRGECSVALASLRQSDGNRVATRKAPGIATFTRGIGAIPHGADTMK